MRDPAHIVLALVMHNIVAVEGRHAHHEEVECVGLDEQVAHGLVLVG